MPLRTRYEPRGVEAEFEPGSRGRVLRNLRGVHLVREMRRLESEALLRATERAIDETYDDQRFTAADICRWHRDWLGELYPWAGEYRNVNLGKGSFMFAAAQQVPRQMMLFEREILGKFTPCRFEKNEEIANAIGVVHAELILIHPFREGNGRCARVLSMLMGLQAGLPPLDFGSVRSEVRRRYIAAIQAAVGRDYAPMTAIFRMVIARTLRQNAEA